MRQDRIGAWIGTLRREKGMTQAQVVLQTRRDELRFAEDSLESARRIAEEMEKLIK